MKTEPGRVSLVWLIFAAFLAVLIVWDVAYATPKNETRASASANASVGGVTVGGDTIGATTLTGGSVTGGDVGGDKNKAYALTNVLGDVDIAGCLGSTQWNTPLYGKQKLVLNNVCMAEFYLKTGKYALAAMALCNQPELLVEFETEEDCEIAHDFTPITIESPITAPEADHDDEDYEALKAELAAVKAEAGKAKAEARYAVREAKKQPQATPQTIIQQQEYLNEDKRAKLYALKDVK